MGSFALLLGPASRVDGPTHPDPRRPKDLRVEPIKSSVDLEDSSILMNISWILRADGKFA